MKALVLSGGTGSRLRPFSYSMPKQLMPVANKPVLEYALENVRQLGAQEVGLVVNEWGPTIAAALGDGSRFGLRITYIRQDEPRGLAHTVQIARQFLGDSDFLMYLGDVMLTESIAEIAAAFRSARPAAQVIVTKVAEPRSCGVVELDQDGAVIRLEEKPLRPRSDLALTGVYFFTSAIHRAVAAITPGARGELEITDAVQWLLSAGADVRASLYYGYYADTGRVEDLLVCNRKLLDRMAASVAGEVDQASELVGAVVVEPGARIVASRIEGPAIIGSGAVVTGSHIGPHTSLGRDCRITGARLDYSIVLDGAAISHVDGLHGSLIGRFATVGRGDTHGRLVVGDHSRVEVAA